MNDEKIEEIAKNVYYLSEDNVYDVIERLKNNENIDQTLTYVYIKAMYMHCIQKYYAIKNNQDEFNRIYNAYKNILKEYYIANNSGISQELLDDILQIFDKSYEFLETLQFKNINDSYEFRHHIIACMELLRHILEGKSKSQIRVDIFDNFITRLKETAEEILDCVRKYGDTSKK